MTARSAYLGLFLTLYISVAALAQTAPAPDGPPTATVLCYHIVEAPADPRMEISREVFRQHLQYLEMTGYNVIPLQHLYEYVTGKRSRIPKNAIVITIDDGWRSTYTEAFPELQKRKFPFTIFIYPKIIGQTANALTWKQIKEMSDAGVDVQSHTLSHGYLTRRRHRSLNEVSYVRWLQKELTESRRILEKQTGKPVRFLAYPYGDFDDVVARQTEKAGYEVGLTCEFGPVRRGSDTFRMKRVVVDGKMDFAAFRKYLGTAPMMLAEVTPSPKEPIAGPVRTITARIPSHTKLDPRSVGMALLSARRPTPYAYDAKNGLITLNLAESLDEMSQRAHRAIVWGIDKVSGKRVEATVVFRKAPPAPKPAEEPLAVSAAAMVTAPRVPSLEGGGAQKR